MMSWAYVLNLLILAACTWFWLWFIIWEVEQRKKEHRAKRLAEDE